MTKFIVFVVALGFSAPALAIQVCDQTQMSQQCVTRQVCHVVSAGGGAAIGDVPGAVAGEAVAQTVCENLPECTPMSVCVHSHQEGP